MSTFYTDNPLTTWQSVLGASMHYHIGGDKTVRNLYPFIDNNSSILDIGCGWGGPATMLHNEKQCTIHGVTNSPQQHQYYPFTSTLADANTYIPDAHYDTTIFIESFCHLTQSTLTNIRPHTKQIIIRDYITPHDWYNEEWQMYMRNESTYHALLSDYTITHQEIDTAADIYNSSLYWYNNISKLSPNLVTNQIYSLYKLTSEVVYNGPQSDFINLITIVAE